MSITIIRGQVNEVVVTLSENATLTNPFYLWRFISKDTNESVYCVAGDTSGYQYRYNSFNIEESETPDLLNAVVTLSPAGEWNYEVYEQASSTNLDPSQVDNLSPLETGLCFVRESATDPAEYDGQDKTRVVYGE